MRRLRLGTGGLVGLLVTAPATALLALGDRLAGLPFLPYDLLDWATRVLPGGVVTFGIDGGPWQEARLRAPLSEATWVLWRHDWPFQKGEHTLEVRCAEADGTPQIEERRKNRPSGATGLHGVEVEV